MRAIRDTGGVLHTDRDQVLGIASDFYEDLSTTDPVAVQIVDAKEQIWSFIHSRVTDDMCYHLMAPFTEKWIEVDGTTQVEALINALSDEAIMFNEDPSRKTLVFANSVEAADAIFKILQQAEIKCSCYHREIPSKERMSTLKAFQDQGGLLVCTDAAARGLDVHNVSHVIQAEFAKSAIDFLHRVGRTARAGQSGAVTSLYTKANRALVEAVRQAAVAGLSVEGAFSRKRSFRNRIKRSELVSQMEE
ncbi:hypothetical protein L7F22_003725 [Adiantum nelumboides]|nr:hypothetical protein [Adiantum nelumboides]